MISIRSRHSRCALAIHRPAIAFADEVWPWAVSLAAAGAFVLTGLAARIGCTCGRDTAQVGGTGAAAALAAQVGGAFGRRPH